jgi:predicted molibdopterin-dependent oxidoreductase YjgC
MADVEFQLNGEAVRCPAGLTIAGALFHLRRTTTRTTRLHAPRTLFCGMGVCCECVMEVDGRTSVRTCMTLVRPGMRVDAQRGDAELTEAS